MKAMAFHKYFILFLALLLTLMKSIYYYDEELQTFASCWILEIIIPVVAPFSKGQDGFCDYLYKVSTKQTPRQSSHSTAPIEGKDNTELDR